jgi:hypothetical protein
MEVIVAGLITTFVAVLLALERGGSRRFWAQTPDVAAGAMAQSVMFASLQDQRFYEMRVRRQSARSYYSAPTLGITRPIPAKSVWMPPGSR